MSEKNHKKSIPIKETIPWNGHVLDRDAVENFFDERAATWEKMNPHDFNKVRHILSLLNLKKGDRIMDVGTGNGILLPFLQELTEHKAEIVAVDLSTKMLAEAAKRYDAPNISFVKGDVGKLHWQENSFDCIICYSVFPHFIEAEKLLAHLHCALKPGGRLIVAHSESKEKINAHHDSGSDAMLEISAGLPLIEHLNIMFIEAGLRVIDRLDTSDMYYVLGVKEKKSH